jgi:DNA-binding beta-propeller fold protein YncE
VAKQVTKTFHLQEVSHPTYVKFDETANRVLVLSQADWKLVLIDGANDTIVKSVPIGIGGINVSANSATHDIFVPNHESGTLTVVSGADLSSRTVPALTAGKYYAPDPENPLAHPGLSVSYPQERKFYIADLGGVLYALDMDTFRILKSIPVGERIRSMFIDIPSKRLFAVSDMDHTLYIVDIAGDTLIKSVKLFDEPVGPKGEYKLKPMRDVTDAFIINDFHGGDLLVFDTRTNEVTKRLKDFDHVLAYGTDSSKGEVYLIGSMDGRVHVLDTATFEKKREFLLPVPKYAFTISVDYLRHKIYYAKGPRVYVVNPEDGSLLKTILLKHPGASSAIILPELNRLYVGLHNGVEAIDLDRDEVVAAFDVDNHQSSFTADRSRGIVYAYITDAVASKGFVYGFDVLSDTIISKVVSEQTLPKFAIPSIDPLSGRIFAPESYAQEIKVVDTKEQTSKTVTAAPERKIFGLSVTTAGIGIVVIAIAVALGYLILRIRATRVV